MEATGQYRNALHDELQRRGHPCVVLNPIQTGNRSMKRIRKTKTDPVDSELIARTILAGDAQVTLVPDESIFELRLLVRHRWKMIKVHTDRPQGHFLFGQKKFFKSSMTAPVKNIPENKGVSQANNRIDLFRNPFIVISSKAGIQT
jgi:transposase